MTEPAGVMDGAQVAENDDKKRRPFGQIYEKNGKTYVRFPDPTSPRIPGKRPRSIVRHVPGGRKAAVKVLGEIHRAITSGTWSPVRPKPESPTVTLTVLGAVDEYLTAKGGDGTAAGTLHKYRTIRNRIAESDLGARPVMELLPADVEAYLRWRQGRKYSAIRRQGERRSAPMAVRVREDATPAPGTIRGDYALISAVLNRLVLNDVLTRNPCARVQKPKPRQKSRPVLSREESAALIAACGPDLRVLVVFLLYTGARLGEALGVRWKDVNLGTGTVSIYRPKVRNAAVLPLHPDLAAELKRHRAARAVAEERLIADSDPVFPGRLHGGDRLRYYPRTAWAYAVKAAKLDGRGITPHALRHTFATAFLQGGAAITDLQHVLGHSSITTTQIYARSVDTRTRTSLLALDFGAKEATIRQIRETMHTPSTPTGQIDGRKGAEPKAPEMAQVAAG